MLLEEIPTVLSLGKLCDDQRYTYHWTSGQKPHLTKNGKRIYCNFSNYTSTGNLSSCFFLFWGGGNFLMQLQFLAPVELFFKQLKGYSF